MVLRGDAGERVGLVAVALEIGLGDAAEHAGEAAIDLALLLQVGGADQYVGDVRGLGHLLGADDEHVPRALRRDGVHALMDRGRSRGAGILDARRRLEAQRRIGLQHQRRGEFLAHEHAHGADENLIDVGGRQPGIGDRVGGDADDQGFDILAFELAEARMRPTHDAGGHVFPRG